jgi:type VI secretion system secreted protein VgrG
MSRTRATRLSVSRRRRIRYFALLAVSLLGASALMAAAPAYAAPGPVGLGTAGSFAVLAGSGITNTGPTRITGDVGTFPTPSETGFGSVTLSGTNHGGDAVTQGAKDDLVAAYNDAAGRTPVTNVPVELGGSTLVEGVYRSPTFGLTGTLTLDAKGSPDAQFIFQAGSTLIAETDSRVLLVNGADPCHVVWQVGSSATFKTATRFVGDVLAHTSITAQTRAVFEGRLLARNGAVTLDTNTITRANCAAPVPSGGTTTTPAANPSAGSDPTLTGAGPASPTGTPGGTPGTPTGTPVGAPGTPTETAGGTPGAPGGPDGPTGTAPRTPSGSPPLAATGAPIGALLGTGLTLLALGAVALVAGRRRWKSPSSPQIHSRSGI